MSNVTVLGPKGRRCIIKITASTSILQIIEDSCIKLKLDPNSYDIKHLRKTLDSSSTVRYSNVPNKAQLELVEVTVPRTDGIVNVHLVTDTGQRLEADFIANATLSEILKHHEKEGKLKIPSADEGNEAVIVYTMRRISGKELELTSLKSLGLMKGRCLLRYNIQSISENGPRQANVSGPLIHSKKENSEQQNAESYLIALEKCTSSISDKENASSNQNRTSPIPKDKICDTLQQVDSVPSSNSNMMTIPPEKTVNEESTMEVDVPVITEEKKTIEETMSIDPAIVEAKEPQVIKFASHDALLFNFDDAPPIQYEEESDEFFDLSVNEVKTLYKEYSKQIRELEETPMLTKAMRDGERDGRLLMAMNKFPVTQLRVCFPDRNVIQASFKPRDTIGDVIEFLKPFLDKPDLEFNLYTIMPKKTLTPTMTLIDADCIPNARIYFESHQGVSGESFLSQETLSKKSSFEGATNTVVKAKKKEALSGTGTVKEDRKDGYTLGASSSRNNQPSNSKQEAKKPKWFKM